MQPRKLELQNAIGIVIKKLRKNTSITQLAYEIDLSKSIWSELEKGNKDIQISTFWRIAEALDIKPSELLIKVEQELGADFSFLEDSPAKLNEVS